MAIFNSYSMLNYQRVYANELGHCLVWDLGFEIAAESRFRNLHNKQQAAAARAAGGLRSFLDIFGQWACKCNRHPPDIMIYADTQNTIYKLYCIILYIYICVMPHIVYYLYAICLHIYDITYISYIVYNIYIVC